MRDHEGRSRRGAGVQCQDHFAEGGVNWPLLILTAASARFRGRSFRLPLVGGTSVRAARTMAAVGLCENDPFISSAKSCIILAAVGPAGVDGGRRPTAASDHCWGGRSDLQESVDEFERSGKTPFLQSPITRCAERWWGRLQEIKYCRKLTEITSTHVAFTLPPGAGDGEGWDSDGCEPEANPKNKIKILGRNEILLARLVSGFFRCGWIT